MAESPNKYSLYAGREMQGTAVNWGQIAADVSGTLGEIAKDRIARRDKIRQDTNDALNQLSQVELGAAADMNSLIIDASAFSKNTVSNAYDMVRQGLMDPKDFQLLMQKQKDGYSEMATYAKQYGVLYQQALDRVNSGEAAGIEEAMRMSGLKFGNLKNKKLWSDPNTGQLVLVDMEEKLDANGDGTGEFFIPQYQGNEDKFAPPITALQMSQYQQNSINFDEQVAANVVQNLGTVIDSQLYQYSILYGNVKDVKDFRQIFDLLPQGQKMINPATGKAMTFDEFLTIEAEGIIPTDVEKLELLHQRVGGFKIIQGTRPAGNTNENEVYFMTGQQGEPIYDLTDAQRAKAMQLVKNEINSQLDFEVTKKAGQQKQQPNQVAINNANQKKKTANYIRDLDTILTGDRASAEALLQKMINTRNIQNTASGQNTISGFDLTDDRIVFYMEDPNGNAVNPIEIERNIFATTDVNNDGVIDARDISSTTTLGVDIANMFDVLVPGGQGITTGMSQADILDFIKSNNITLGQRGQDRVVTFVQPRTPPVQYLPGSKKQTGPNKVETMVQYFEGGNIGDVVNAVGDTDDGLTEDIERLYNMFQQQANIQNFRDAGFSNLRFYNVNNNQYISYDDNNGVTQRIKLGDKISENGTTSDTIVNAVTEGMNKLNEAAFNVVNAGGQTTRAVSFATWSAQNPRGANETPQDYLKRYKQEAYTR